MIRKSCFENATPLTCWHSMLDTRGGFRCKEGFRKSKRFAAHLCWEVPWVSMSTCSKALHSCRSADAHEIHHRPQKTTRAMTRRRDTTLRHPATQHQGLARGMAWGLCQLSKAKQFGSQESRLNQIEQLSRNAVNVLRPLLFPPEAALLS